MWDVDVLKFTHNIGAHASTAPHVYKGFVTV